MTNAASSVGLSVGWSARLADFAELTKPRIAVLVSMSVATAVCLAADAPQLLIFGRRTVPTSRSRETLPALPTKWPA